MNGTKDTVKAEIKIKQEIEETEFDISSIKIEPGFECKVEPSCDSKLEESNFVFVTSADVKTEIVEDVKTEIIDDIAATHTQNQTLWLNQQKYVERKSYECGTCGDHFEKLRKFIDHLKTHGDSEQDWEKYLLCDICEKPFETLSNLNRHRSSSHKIYEKSLATKMLEDCLVRFTQSGLKMDVGSDEQNSNREAYMVSIGNYRKRKTEDNKNANDKEPSNSKENDDEKSDKTFKPVIKKKSYYKKKRQSNMIDLPEGTDKKQYFLALEAALKNKKKKL